MNHNESEQQDGAIYNLHGSSCVVWILYRCADRLINQWPFALHHWRKIQEKWPEGDIPEIRHTYVYSINSDFSFWYNGFKSH